MGDETNERPELAKPAGHLLGDGLVRLIGGLASIFAGGFAFWMLTIHTSLATLDVKLDQINASIAAANDVALEANAIARDNTRRVDRIEATRFTDGDAVKLIAPLEHRLNQLESGRKR